MTDDEILALAHRVMKESTCPSKWLFAFARAVAAHEREECAKVCEAVPSTYHGNDPQACAAAIRSRT